MKKTAFLFLSLLLLTACVSAPTETPTAAPTETAQGSPSAALPDFLADFSLDRVEVGTPDEEGNCASYTVSLLTDSQAADLQALLAVEDWITADDLPAIGYHPHTVYLYDAAGNSVHFAFWGEEHCLVNCFSAAGEVVRLFAPAALLDALSDFAAALPPFGVIDSAARDYLALFRADSGLTPLLALSVEGGDGNLSDEQMVAYAIQTWGGQGTYDYERGFSQAQLDEFTQARFGKTLTDYDNAMSCVLPDGSITATGWSFDCDVFPILDGTPSGQLGVLSETEDGIITARFLCYQIPDSFWDDLSPDLKAHWAEYLLTGQDDAFPAPYTAEITLELASDDLWATSYLRYHSIRRIPTP